MRRPLTIALLLLLCCFIAAAADPFNGKWRIDTPKSSWSDGNFPKNMSITIDLAIDGDRIKYHGVNDTNKDKLYIVDYTAKFDGRKYPIPNNDRYNMVSIRRLGKNEMKVLEWKDDDVVVGAIWELFPGGKRCVRRGIAKNANRKSHEYEEFFDKQ